jgi:hypothetical protein
MEKKDRSRHRVAECQKDESDDHLPATLRPAESLLLLLLLSTASPNLIASHSSVATSFSRYVPDTSICLLPYPPR